MSKRVLFVSPVRCLPGHSGRSARILRLVKEFQYNGCDIHFAFVNIRSEGSDIQCKEYFGNQYYKIPFEFSKNVKTKLTPSGTTKIYNKVVSRLSDLLQIDNPIFTHGIDDWFCELSRKYLVDLIAQIQPEIVMVEYVFLSWVLECVDAQTTKIIDTHDLFGDSYKKTSPTLRSPIQFSCTPKDELDGLSRADFVIAIQENERQYFADNLPTKEIVCIGHFVDIKPSKKKDENTANIGYIGTPNINNKEGIKYFLKEIFPKILSQVDNVKLILAGGICNVVEEDEKIVKLGEITDLQQFYDAVDLTINSPLRGKGLAIKSVESLGFCKPLITTTAGARGLEKWADKAFFVAKTSDDFVEKSVRVLSNPQIAQQLSHEAFLFAQEWNQHNSDLVKSLIDYNK